MGFRFRLRRDWHPDWGLPIFILAAIAFARVALGMTFGHLDGVGLMLCVALGAGLGTLLHCAVSGRKTPRQ